MHHLRVVPVLLGHTVAVSTIAALVALGAISTAAPVRAAASPAQDPSIDPAKSAVVTATASNITVDGALDDRPAPSWMVWCLRTVSPNLEWDAIWTVRTRRTSEGWSAEFEIPFKSLSFPPGKSRWGFNISRTI